ATVATTETVSDNTSSGTISVHGSDDELSSPKHLKDHRPASPPPSAQKDSQTIHVKILKQAQKVQQSEFEAENHYYPRVLNAAIHPLVASFFNLGTERIIARYVHLNPQVNEAKLRELLKYQPTYFRWAGSDLFNVTTASGFRQMV
ncbi:hypothetical protein EV182_008815, partial [Spiromyces aspiralis]